MNVVAERIMPRGGEDTQEGKAKTTGELGKTSFLKMASLLHYIVGSVIFSILNAAGSSMVLRAVNMKSSHDVTGLFQLFLPFKGWRPRLYRLLHALCCIYYRTFTEGLGTDWPPRNVCR